MFQRGKILKGKKIVLYSLKTVIGEVFLFFYLFVFLYKVVDSCLTERSFCEEGAHGACEVALSL